MGESMRQGAKEAVGVGVCDYRGPEGGHVQSTEFDQELAREASPECERQEAGEEEERSRRCCRDVRRESSRGRRWTDQRCHLASSSSVSTQGRLELNVTPPHIRPFGSQDYPVGEQPAPDLESNVAPTNGGGDTHVATRVQPKPVNPLEGLEEQSKLVKELGDEEVDDLLDENLVIYRGVEDDDETDHEEEEHVALREGREIVRADVKEKRSVRRCISSS